MEPTEYCRQVEAYLCRKNEGHLIRIVGPAFEQVCGWAASGVPLKVAFRGIDQYCERYYAKGPRRRPVRIEFCEPDILDLFDRWRRSIGVPRVENGTAAEESSSRKPALGRHLERAIARLTSVRAGSARSATFNERVDGIVRQLDRLLADGRGARGDARSAIVDTLRALDEELLGAARMEANDEVLAALAREADGELAPFKARMPEDEFARVHAAARDRLLREAFGLPHLTYD